MKFNNELIDNIFNYLYIISFKRHLNARKMFTCYFIYISTSVFDLKQGKYFLSEYTYKIIAGTGLAPPL